VGDLERKLQVAEAVIRKFLPHIDLEDAAAMDDALCNASPLGTVNLHVPRSLGNDESRADFAPTEAAAVEEMPESARFIPLVEGIGQLDLTDKDEYDFHGLSSGAAFLSRITRHFPELLRYDARMPFLPQANRPFIALPLGLPAYSANSWWEANYDYMKLPPRDLALTLCEYSFNRASCILKVVHTPSFYAMFHKLYSKSTKDFTEEERRFAGMLFSVVALGSMYDVDENDSTNPDHYAVAMDRG
jgi:hypothetical protein